MYNKAIFRLGFCIQNNHGPGKCYQSRPLAQLITITWTLIIPDITKTSSNNTYNIRPYNLLLILPVLMLLLLLLIRISSVYTNISVNYKYVHCKCKVAKEIDSLF